MAAIFCLSGAAQAQVTNSNFNVTVNTGPVAPNDDTVNPGEPTSLRISLANNSTLNPLTGVNFDKDLPTTAIAALRVNGASSINGDAGCVGGTLTTNIGQAGVELSGLTIPARVDGVAGSGECYIDIPVVGTSVNGASTSLSYSLNAGEVDSNEGSNATGGPQAITLLSVARPTWSKTLTSGNIVTLGGSSNTLRITVRNPDDEISLSNVAFVDTLPVSGVDGAAIEPTGAAATGSCVGGAVGGAVTLQTGANASIGVSGITLAPASSCTIDVEVQARHTNGNYQLNATNTIPAADFSADEGLQPSSDASNNIRVRSPLAVSKSFLPGVIASGVTSAGRIVLTNSSASALPVTRFADNPIGVNGGGLQGLTIAAPGDVSNSCGGAVNLLNVDKGFELTGFSIPANGSCTIDFDFTGTTPNADEPTTYTNQIPQGAVEITGQPGIVSQARSATVIVADRLWVLKSRTPASAAPGNPVRYTVTVQNYSNAALANVEVADNLQNGSTFLTDPGFEPGLTAACGTLDLNGAVQGDSNLLFTVPTVPARTSISAPGQCAITFWAMTDPASTTNTSNQIASGGACIGGNPATCNQSASQNVTTSYQQALVLNKTFDGQNNRSLFEGQISRLNLQLDNYSSNPMTTVTISDTLPDDGPFQQLRIASPANVSNSCGGTVTAVAGQTSVALNNGSLPALAGNVAGTCTVSVDVVGPAGIYPNTADATALQTYANGSTATVNDSDNATLTYTDALSVSKSFSPTQIGPGGTSTVRVRFTNLDAVRPITGIQVLDNLPADMIVASPGNAYTTCNGSPIVNATDGAASAGLSGATLAPGATCELLFDVTVSGNSDWTNTIAPGQITADGGLVNRNPVSATLTFSAPSIPVISKSINPGTIVPGESALLTINITNGSEAVSNLQLADYFTADGLPGSAANGMTLATMPQFSTSCPGGVVSGGANQRSVMLSGANLAPNQSCQVQAMVTSSQVGTITNTIPLNAMVTSEGATNSSTFGQSTLSTTDTVGVSKLFTPAVVSPAEASVLRITFFNAQSGALSNFSITDFFPAGLVSDADPQPFSNCGGGVAISYPDPGSVRLEGGSLGPAVDGEAASCYLETRVVANTEGTYVNSIPANSLLVNGIPATHPPTDATLEVRERIVINKAIDDLTLDVGDPAGFTTGTATRLPGIPAPLVIRLENPNDIPLTQVAFTDSLPDGLVVAAVPNVSTSCTDGIVAAQPSGRDVVLTGATLAATGNAGSNCTVEVDVVSNIPGIYTNEIGADAVSSFEGISNLEPTQAQIVVSRPPGVGKEFSPPVIAPGASSVLSIVIRNDNDLDMTLSAPLVDNLPATPGTMLVATPNGLNTSCPGGNGIVTAPAGANTVQINNGSVIPPGGCVVNVDVTAIDAGEYINNIPVGALQTDFGPNDSPATSPLQVSTLGYISGKVFIDNQNSPNGDYLPGESTVVAGNTIELHSSASCDDPAPVITQTDAQGNYLFTGLSAGTYSVCQPDQPADTLNSVTRPGIIAPYAGSTGTAGTAANPGNGMPTSQITAVVLNNNGNADEVSGSPQNNFSEVLPASIAGNVYYDRDNNGNIDPADTGIGGVTIELGGPVSLTTVTAPDGSYQFEGLPPGNYTVREVQPAGWTDGTDTAGSEGGDASANDVISAVALAPGAAATQYNFGERIQDPLSIDARVSCVQDAPYVEYSVSSFEGFNGAAAPLVTITWLTPGGRVAQRLENQPASGTLLWPGAGVDGGGVGNAWPGWEFVNDEWREVPDDRRPEMTFRVDINPTAQADLTYPPPSAACATQPRGTFSVGIPTTPQWMLLLMALMMAVTASAALARRQV